VLSVKGVTGMGRHALPAASRRLEDGKSSRVSRTARMRVCSERRGVGHIYGIVLELSDDLGVVLGHGSLDAGLRPGFHNSRLVVV